MSKKSTSRYDGSDRGVVAERILESKMDPTIKEEYEPRKKKEDEPETHSGDQKYREKHQRS